MSEWIEVDGVRYGEHMLRAMRERLIELDEFYVAMNGVSEGTPLETVMRLEAQLTALQAERDDARHERDEQRGLFLEAKVERDAWETNYNLIRTERDAAVRECEVLRAAADMLREIPPAALTADKVYREDWPELFTDGDGSALCLETAVERVLDRITTLAKERSAAAAVREGSK